MNREIKFRLWDDGKKCWTNPGLLRIDNNGELYTQRDGGPYVESQYTGFKDKNGKEIYEGDIILLYHLINNGKYETCYDLEIKAVVAWGKETPGFVTNEQALGYIAERSLVRYCMGHGNEDKYAGYEIIGNKFENPELMENVK